MSSYIFQSYARQIKKETGIDCFSKRRTDAHAIARSILNQVYMQSQPNVKLREITALYKENGRTMNHATVIHSLKSFDMYIDLPLSRQKREIGTSVRTVYYRLLLFYNGTRKKNLKIAEKMEFLLPNQKEEINNMIDYYADKNIQNYVTNATE
tara:strand:- start:192 stop:650 length:459 start_codon:yes stop_codon:yes gene_type:complete